MLLKFFKERPSKLEKGYSQVLVKQSLHCLVFQKLDHLTCNGILRINRNEINGFIHVIEERHK